MAGHVNAVYSQAPGSNAFTYWTKLAQELPFKCLFLVYLRGCIAIVIVQLEVRICDHVETMGLLA